MNYSVSITESAERDLEDIHDYLYREESPGRALSVIEWIEKKIENLETFPGRGVISPELSVLGNRSYREVFYKPYRIVYRIEEAAVRVVLVADGRRDMRTLLQKRLLDS